jgi:hypothetical protein
MSAYPGGFRHNFPIHLPLVSVPSFFWQATNSSRPPTATENKASDCELLFIAHKPPNPLFVLFSSVSRLKENVIQWKRYPPVIEDKEPLDMLKQRNNKPNILCLPVMLPPKSLIMSEKLKK